MLCSKKKITNLTSLKVVQCELFKNVFYFPLLIVFLLLFVGASGTISQSLTVDSQKTLASFGPTRSKNHQASASWFQWRGSKEDWKWLKQYLTNVISVFSAFFIQVQNKRQKHFKKITSHVEVLVCATVMYINIICL